MPQVFLNIPTVAGNGAGAALNISTLGARKTFVCAAGTSVLVTLEIANDAAGTLWVPIHTFQGTGDVTLDLAARFVRTVTQNNVGGGPANVDIGAEVEPVVFATLVAPAGNGPGAAVGTNLLPGLKTVIVTGPFSGTCNIELSDDNVAWSTAMSFPIVQDQTLSFVANFMRVNRTGVSVTNPGLPIVNIAASGPAGGGGGGGNYQEFLYTVTGAEVPSLSDFTVNLPAARASTNYGVLATLQSAVAIVGMDIPNANKLVGSFRIVSTANFTIGDIICFQAMDLT